jgi:hypothetical protein
VQYSFSRDRGSGMSLFLLPLFAKSPSTSGQVPQATGGFLLTRGTLLTQMN